MTVQSAAQKTNQPVAAPPAGVLLIHGLNGSLRDMAEVEEVLQSNNLVTRSVLLPGHGTHVRDMLPLGWPEWAASVEQEYQALRRRCGRVFLVGHSMGGALALHTAAHHEVAGVVSMCAPLHLSPWLKLLVRAAQYVVPLVPTLREDVCDPEARRRHTRDVYRWTPIQPVASLMAYLPTLRAELPRITAPSLIMVSARDHVVPARDGREIYRQLCSREKYLVAFHHS